MANFIPNLNQIRDGANFLATYIRKALEAIQAKFPIKKDDIASVWGAVIDWANSPILPADIIPWDSAPANAALSFVNCIDIYRDGVCQYKDDNELYFGPGHILHRGLFKTQTCNDDRTWVSALASSLTIADECVVPGPVTTTGLDADSWYYAYWKLDVAGEGPEYRISKIPPVRCDGRGPEHPAYDKLRFVGSFRTIADGVIRPFHRHSNGWVFWRDIVVGPESPDYNLLPPNASAGWVTVSGVDQWAPPSADFITHTYDVQGDGGQHGSRTDGDVAVMSGFDYDEPTESATVGLPVGTMDLATGMPTTQASIQYFSSGGDDSLAISGYHEALL